MTRGLCPTCGAEYPRHTASCTQAVAIAQRQRNTDAYEKVDHPAHYGGADNPYEAIKIIEALKMSFNLGTAFRYIARQGKKPGEGAVEDLRKARWYLDREIQNLIKEQQS